MYWEFVSRIINCICKYSEISEKELHVLGYGEGNGKGYLQDFAQLRGQKAELFLGLIWKYSHIFCIDCNDYQGTYSKIEKNMLKYAHSCYAKNLRRWMNGTVSRKKRCRVEFVVLMLCWALKWGNISAGESECAKELVQICIEYIDEKEEIQEEPFESMLVELMWKASSNSYKNI